MIFVPLTASGMWLDADLEQAVAAARRLAAEAHRLAFLDAGGNLDGNFVVFYLQVNRATLSRGQEGNRDLGLDFLARSLPARAAAT